MNLINTAFTKEHINCAWRAVREKGKSGGIDNITLSEFEKNRDKNIDELSSEVIQGRYIPEPYKRIYVEKNSSSAEQRPLAMLAIKDKIVQVCFLNFFRSKIEKKFVDTSYAYRIGKSHNKAINRINDFISRHNTWVCAIDIDNFYDTIDRQILLQKCRSLFNDAGILKLLEMWIRTGIVYKGKYIDSGIGLAQGGVISPFLSNIYLHSYDKEMKNRNFNNVRYADNIVLIEKEKERLLQSLSFTKTYLKNELKLNLNRIDREAIDISSECFTFCGIQFIDGKRKIDANKLEGIKKDITKILKKENFDNISVKINEHIEGIKRYYRAFNTEDQIIVIEEHLINALTEKIKLELARKNIKSVKDVKKILSRIFFLTPKTTTGREALIKEISDNCFAEQRSSAKTEAERAVGKKRKQYQKIWFENLDILISGAYSQIGKSGYKITIRKEGKVRTEMSVDRIKNILISSRAVTISSDAVKLCSEKNIRINYFDELGKPYASIIPAAAPVNLLFIKQSEALTSAKAAIIARNIVFAKIKNQQSIIKYFSKNKKGNSNELGDIKKEIDDISTILNSVKEIDVKMKLAQLREKLMGYEGSAAVNYWKVFGKFIPKEYEFEKREHRGAENIVNIMLNYAYGILYTRVLSAVTLLGLNPNLSFLHTEHKDKPALVYDLIEIFRAPVADRTVIAILNKGVKVKAEKKLLSERTKSHLAKKVLQRLNTEFIHRGKVTSFNQLIIEQVKALIAFIDNESKTYKPFLSKW